MREAWIFQINAGQGMPKQVVNQAVVTEDGIEGDGQRNRELHGGIERALCLFSLDRQAQAADSREVCVKRSSSHRPR